MAANFLLNLPKKTIKRADKLDLLPFGTETSCNAPIDKYFRSVIHTNDKKGFYYMTNIYYCKVTA
jgi:hypothetical protein